jgi:DHA1 family inner membrane transport protein
MCHFLTGRARQYRLSGRHRKAHHAGMTSLSADPADRDSRHAAIALALALPADVLLYLLLPMYADDFGITLAEAGGLLAANRLVRIAGYGVVARGYARYGDRTTCSIAVVLAAACALGNSVLSGFWALLVLRLTWGLCYAALNLSTQALATVHIQGAAQRTGASRAWIALGPVVALPAGAWLTLQYGPRVIFVILTFVALLGVIATRALPTGAHPTLHAQRRRLRWPDRLNLWSFVEGLTLDGLFILGLAFLGKDLLPGQAVLVAGLLLALRYLSEMLLGRMGGRLADRHGAMRMLVALSLATAGALLAFGAGWLWSAAAVIVVLRALQLPLVAPLVMARYPGPARVQALASQAIWRDIGAGAGPLIAGLLLARVPSIALYGAAALALAVAALSCRAEAAIRPATVSDSA